LQFFHAMEEKQGSFCYRIGCILWQQG